MKKIILLSTCFISLSLFAQPDSLKPVQNQVGFGLNVSGLIKNIGLSTFKDANKNDALWAKYYLSNKNVLRFGLGIFSISNEYKTSDSVGTALVETDSTYKRNDIGFTLGYERHFSNLKRLDPYLGAELALGFVGRTKIHSEIKTTDAIGISTNQDIIQEDGGTNLGVHLLVGFNYFIAKQLAVGAEYKFGYDLQSLGGDYSESIIDTPASGSSTSTFVQKTAKQKNSGLSTSSNAAITLSYYF